MRKFSKTITIILLTTGFSFSQSFFSQLASYHPMASSPRSLGLGFVSLASDGLPAALETNPAMISGNKKVILTTDLDLKRISEKRSFPVIDSFGDFLTNNIYVANKNYYLNGALGVIYRPLRQLSLGVNVSSKNVSYFRYVEEVRGTVYGYYNRDPLVGYHMMGNSCKVVYYTLGVAGQVFKRVDVGLSFSSGVVTRTDYFYEIDAIEGLASNENLAVGKDIRVESKAYRIPKTKINAGLSYSLNKRLKLGAFYNSSYTIRINNPPYILYPDSELSLPKVFVDTLGIIKSVRYKYPISFGLSIKYMPRNIVPTKFFFEITRALWKNFEAKVTYQDSTTSNLFQKDFDFKNSLTVKLGVEHDFFSGAVLRVGFCHRGSPIDPSLNRAWITAGTAYRGDNFEVDFSVAFTGGEYTYPDLFPVIGQERVSDDTISETTVVGKIGFTYRF